MLSTDPAQDKAPDDLEAPPISVNDIVVNSLTTEKQTTKFPSAHFQNIFNPSYIIYRIQRLEDKQCRS